MGLLFLIPIHTPTSMGPKYMAAHAPEEPGQVRPDKDVTRGLTHR